MKVKFFLTMIMLMVSVAMSAAKVTEVFTLDHQMSQTCEKKIMSNLRYEKGVKDMKVSLKENTITITYDDTKTDTGKLLQAFNKIGFNAMLASEAKATATAGTCCKEKVAGEKACCKDKAGEKACCKDKAGEKACCKDKAGEKKDCCKKKGGK